MMATMRLTVKTMAESNKDEFNCDDLDEKGDKEDHKHEEKEDPDISLEEMKRRAMGIGSEEEDPVTARHQRAFNLAAYVRHNNEALFKANRSNKMIDIGNIASYYATGLGAINTRGMRNAINYTSRDILLIVNSVGKTLKTT